MSIVSRKRGEQVQFPEGFSVTVLELDRCGVKLGISFSANGEDHATANEQLALASIRSQGSAYYLFPQGGVCTLVVRCETGKRVSFNGTSTLAVQSIANGTATLRLASKAAVHS